MNRKIDIQFLEEAPPVEIRAVTSGRHDCKPRLALRSQFWLGWQFFGLE